MHPGTTEIQWLADLKSTAERVGQEVLGYAIRWSVETNKATGSKRSDVLIETDDGTVFLTGEAKRPDDEAGAHPLLAAEVENAVAKAQRHGVPWCFTTNFFQLAFLDAGPGLANRPLLRLRGPLIAFVPRSLAAAPGWWDRLTTAKRTDATETGLRRLFERYLSISKGVVPQVPIEETALSFFADMTHALLGPLHTTFESTKAGDDPALRIRALTAGLDVADAQQSRYLVAQGIAEVLTASLFHRLLRDHFEEIGPLLGGTTPRTSSTLARIVTKSLGEATRTSGDYQTILSLSEVGRWVLETAPPNVIRPWLALIGFVEHIDLTEISSDILGRIFERLISPERRHDMGQHYTNPGLARLMAEWGVTDPSATVLDPACGAGTFLVETYLRHEGFGMSHDEILAHTLGNDLDPFAVHLAAINLATRRIHKGLNYPQVRLGDAFEITPGESMVKVAGYEAPEISFEPVDLIIANPPYGRSHARESYASASLEKLGLSVRPQMSGGNIAAWFVLLGVALKKPQGRMAFVLPSAVLQNENLADWRAWLRARFDVVIWHSEHDIWFSDARIATCVALFTPRGLGLTETVHGQELGSLMFADLHEPIDQHISYVDGVPVPALGVEIRDLTSLGPDEDILISGTLPDELLKFSQLPGVCELGDLDGFDVRAGEKLGHSMFKLKDLDPESPGALRTVQGLGTTMRINREHLSPMLTSPKQLRSGLIDRSNEYLLALSRDRPRSKTLSSYLTLAQSQGIDKEPSIRSRGKSWWSLDAAPVDVAVPMNGQFRHQVAWCDPRMVANNNFNTIRATDREKAEWVAASLASAFGALSRLYLSGEIGCEGARRVLLSQLVRWPTLNPSQVNEKLMTNALNSYRAWRSFEVSELDEMNDAEAQAWSQLTRHVAYAASGREDEGSRQLADRAVSRARATVLRRRVRETRALSGRTRKGKTKGPSLRLRIRRWLESNGNWLACLELLTAGPEVISLRSVAEINQPRLFGDSNSFDADPDAERRLAEVLGAGFRAAWPDPLRESSQLDQLTGMLNDLLAEAPIALLGEEPPLDNPAWANWEELKKGVLAACARVMQEQVSDVLM